MKKIIIKAPVLSRSGYGEQARFAVRALASRPDLFDLHIINIPWGNTGMVMGNSEERVFLDSLIYKTSQHMSEKGNVPENAYGFDASLQITIPPEFEKMAPVNIGYTAGIETTQVAPLWIQHTNAVMDKIITISEHSRTSFADVEYESVDPGTGNRNKLSLEVPVDVVNYPTQQHAPVEVDIPFETSTNFLVVSQWGPRKNMENTVKWFVETFKDNPDVGLVLKTNLISDSIADRARTSAYLEAFLNNIPDRQCKIYLLHGEISPGQLTWLYQHPTMKALINIGHGEGYGLPMFEAAYNRLPLIAIPWSGHMDFICRKNKKDKQVPTIIKVDYEVRAVQPEAVWENIITAESKWAFPKASSFRSALKEAITKEKHYRTRAKILQEQILKKHMPEKIYEQFVQSVQDVFEESTEIEGTSNVLLL